MLFSSILCASLSTDAIEIPSLSFASLIISAEGVVTLVVSGVDAWVGMPVCACGG